MGACERVLPATESNGMPEQAAIAIRAALHADDDADLLESGYGCSNWPDARSRAAREAYTSRGIRKARRAALIAEDDAGELAGGYGCSHWSGASETCTALQ